MAGVLAVLFKRFYAEMLFDVGFNFSIDGFSDWRCAPNRTARSDLTLPGAAGC
jgi:hypothetical protein